MTAVFTWLANMGRAALGLVLPIFQKAPKPGTRRVLFTILQVIVFLAVLVLLWWINQYEWVYKKILKGESFARFWLPLLFVGVYTLCLLANWLWRLLLTEDDGLYFRDIDMAWKEAVEALAASDIGVRRLPLFLILGHPAEEETALLEGARLDLIVNHRPNWQGAPLHIYATRQAIYLTCGGASLLSYYAQCLSTKISTSTGDAAEIEATINDTVAPGRGRRSPLGGNNIPEVLLAKLNQLEREGRPATKAEVREMRAAYRLSPAYRSPLKDTQRIALQAQRLEFLCRLLARDREPYCAVNGLLVLVPFAGTDSPQDAKDTAQALSADLAVTRKSLRMNCGHYVLVVDMETAPGFTELIGTFSPKDRARRFGQRCPLNPDLREVPASAGEPAAAVLASLGESLCSATVPAWVFDKFELEQKPEDDRVPLIRKNSQLFQLSCEMQERSELLGKILAQGGLSRQAEDGPLLLGGCYLAGTGPNPEKEQAFIKGVVQDRLIGSQSCVYWNNATLAEEARYERWLVFGWTLLLLLWVLVAVVLVILWSST
jgi:hypothetical protein